MVHNSMPGVILETLMGPQAMFVFGSYQVSMWIYEAKRWTVIHLKEVWYYNARGKSGTTNRATSYCL